MARPRSFNEDQIIDAVRNEFWNTGYAATSMDNLMAATGLGKGSLYGAFGDKHQLFLRAYDDYCTDAESSARQELEGDEAGAYERLRTYVFGTVESIASDSEHRGCMLAKASAELAGEEPIVANRALQIYRLIEDLLVTCIEQAQRHGDIATSVDARQEGKLLLAALRGMEALGKVGMDEASLRSIAESALSRL